MTPDLILLRHGESDWNRRNLFTGWRDVPLTETGIAEARAAGRTLSAAGVIIDVAFTSALIRASHTLELVLAELGQSPLVIADAALNERDYGELTGLNKDDARARWGDEQVHVWRRSFDIAPPGGESLKDTAARVLPYWDAAIAPHLAAGERVLVAAHGNSLRALIMRLEGLSPDTILALNLATGVPRAYRRENDGLALSTVGT